MRALQLSSLCDFTRVNCFTFFMGQAARAKKLHLCLCVNSDVNDNLRSYS